MALSAHKHDKKTPAASKEKEKSEKVTEKEEINMTFANVEIVSFDPVERHAGAMSSNTLLYRSRG